jgi:hypothetical protein
MIPLSGRYKLAVKTADNDIAINSSPLRNDGAITRMVSTHHCRNGDGFGRATVQVVVN